MESMNETPSASFRTDLHLIPAYVPGRSIPDACKLASNEVVAGPSQRVLDAILEEAASANRYPDTSSADLRAAIANTINRDLQQHNPSTDSHITPENVVVGNGSVALLQHLIQATCTGNAAAGDEHVAPKDVVMPWRSFEAYPILARVAGAGIVQVPLLPDATHDMAAMADAANQPNVGLVMLCNPNNPTGETFSNQQLVDFLEAIPQDVVVALDEAYYHYNRRGDEPRSVELLQQFPNLVIFRTFSKAYGLAGLRVGYMLGSEYACTQLGKVVIPFSSNRLAQVAALAALQERDELMARTEEVVSERQRVRDALINIGFDVPNSEANFVWIPTREATKLTDYMTEQGVLVRSFAGEGVRITVTTKEENDRMLNAIAGYPGLPR